MKQKSLVSVHKLSLKEFIWFGFNFVVGTTFMSSFAVLANTSSGGNTGLGFWVILVWMLEGFFASVCAFSFAKMSRYHNANQNGAAYVYTRSTFGKLTGLFVGFLQYVYIPFSLSYQIMNVMRGLFTAPFISSTSPVFLYWGSFTDLWMDLISISVFFGCALVVMLGMRWYKKLSNATAGIKWFAFLLMIILAIFIACSNANNATGTNGANNLSYWASHSKFSFDNFVKCFNSCFFAFIGFELFASAGKNVQNPQKTIGVGIVVIMLIATLFYASFTFLFFCSTQTFTETYNISIWNSIRVPWIMWAGIIITLISIIGMRMYSFMHKSLFGGTTLQPLAREGFFPDKFAKLNKEKVPISASKLNLCVVGCVAIVWLIIPDIIKSVALTQRYGWWDETAYISFGVLFNMQTFSSFASLIAIFIYIMVLIATIKLCVTSQIKFKYWELVFYIFTLGILFVIFTYHYYNLIDKAIQAYTHNTSNQDKIKVITGLVIELGTTIAICAFFFGWYKAHYNKILHTRTKIQQKRLDKAFQRIQLATN